MELEQLFSNVGSVMQPVIIPAGSMISFDFEARPEERFAPAGTYSSMPMNFFPRCTHIQTKTELKQTAVGHKSTARLQCAQLQIPAERRLRASLGTDPHCYGNVRFLIDS